MTTAKTTKKKTGGYKNINIKEYLAIKNLQEAGITQAQAVAISKRGVSTVNYIYRSTSFEDYHTMSAGSTKAYKQKVAALKAQAAPIVEAGSVAEQLVNELDEEMLNGRDSHTLYRIADALERIADAIEAQPTKRSLF